MAEHPMRHHTFRAPEDHLEKAKLLGLDLNEILRNALAKAVKALECPTCGAKLKPK